MVARFEVVNSVLELFLDPSYLEIGVNKGETFFAVSAPKKVAVDPKFLFDVNEAAQSDLQSAFFEITSDEYFCDKLKDEDLFDVIYLDGLHTFEQTLRDFTNSIEHLSEGGVIIIDDVKPNSYDASLPNIDTAYELKKSLGITDGSWMGDTYRLIYCLETFFPMYTYRTINDNHGQAVVWKGRRRNSSFPNRTMEAVSRLPFEALILERASLYEKPFADILTDLRNRPRRAAFHTR